MLLGEAEKTQVTKKMLSAMVGTLALAGATLAADATIADVEQRSGEVGQRDSEVGQLSAEDGVYTDEQADRGERAYEIECGTCHGADLRGGETSISLMGRDFMQYWREESLGILYGIIQETMPEDDPGRLSDRETVDLIAMMLRANLLPAGDEELEPDQEMLFEIRLTAATAQ
ncbi:MAG TPA: cytochrome c [Acidobacteriota bacterium]|nr:cytochrome c [Acidobacteriota bacterium]